MNPRVRSSVLELHVPMQHTTRVVPVLDSAICVAPNIMEERRRGRWGNAGENPPPCVGLVPRDTAVVPTQPERCRSNLPPRSLLLLEMGRRQESM